MHAGVDSVREHAFDCVVIRSVMEHVEHPERTFAELARVTKPGGYVLMNLPNKWDYVSVHRAADRPLQVLHPQDGRADRVGGLSGDVPVQHAAQLD